nr:glycine--tRNA ligase subunit beta [Helcococcus sueciensis]
MNRYLLEVGVEEFPAKYIKQTKLQFKNKIEEILKENNYLYDEIVVNSSPRRFAILVENIKLNEENSEEKIKGPSKKIAYDEEGNPSRALQGFMRSKNLELKDLVIEELNGEEYIYAYIRKKAKPINEVLHDGIPNIIKNISNPRQMRWGGKNLRFLRPIRWIVSILDDKVLKFNLEGIQVSNITKGHRTLGSSEIIINSIDEYESKLEENFVIVSESKRRKMILKGINRLSREKGGAYHEDEDLLEEIIHINEYPTPFIGEFDPKYLSLPKEVIITPMKDHQRYFPVEDGENLLPYFISVRNGDEKGIENVVKGNEKVLVARLEDAKFFYEKDLKTNLEDNVKELESLSYHDGLGNMLDKTYRLQKLVQIIGEDMMCGQEAINISSRAAYLSKADLVTSTVIEFTELQGIMGRIFAEESGESQLVSTAIEEQYMPVKSGSELPKTTSGRILSIADKLDTIVGLHSIGIEVTGSQDPYGQRRAVIGMLNILMKFKINLNLKNMIREALYIYVDMFGETFDFEAVNTKVEEFIRTRFRNLLIDEGYKHDFVDSIINQKDLNIYQMYQKLKTITQRNESKESFNQDLNRYIRIVNMSSNSTTDEINTEYLQDEDQVIYNELYRLQDIDNAINESAFEKSLDLLDELVFEMDKYLDNTHIMTDDENVKNARLAIIKSVDKRIKEIFDPTKIVR